MVAQTMNRPGMTGPAGAAQAGNGAMQTAEAEAHSEGPIARMIEEHTAKLPSDVFLWAAGASIITSLVFKLSNKPHEALFVGQWAAPFLILGLYNKVVKVAGSDRVSAGTHKLGG